jgi:hypothetical protein
MNGKAQDPVYKLVSLTRGLYARVALKVGCDPSYVSRIARKERRSAMVEAALRREFRSALRKIERSFPNLNKTRHRDKSGGRLKNNR